ncbi:MAG: adenylate/guanylate cyclase domain-containing protein [Bradyrhizobium sp.]|uniref:adenylate/guanylate cyclase domain-containing protein n=1 Tax=Bradyrhizobium sp. TaxID=376 RepID=UPI003D0BD267
MSSRRLTRDAIAATAIALACAGIAVSPALERIHGLSLDILTALRFETFGNRHSPKASPTVVVAIDEESSGAAPFKGSPTLTWTGEIGRVLNAVVEGGARVVGFDMIIPTSIEQSEIPFGDGMFGERVRGFDRDFLRALAGAATPGKIVLGEQLRGNDPIRPAPGQRIAVRQQQNIRPLNVITDGDDTVRRMPLSFIVNGARVSGMALELAARAQSAKPEFAADGSVTLAGYTIPSATANTLTLNFEGGADDIPTYSLADLRACALKNDKDYFKRAFNGKVVLFGTVLDNEDRKLTSKRFATGLEGARAARCAGESKPITTSFSRSSIAGIYIHATAVNNLIRQEAAVEIGDRATFAIATLIALLAAAGALLFAPIGAAAAFLLLAAVGVVDAVVAFKYGTVIPIVEPFFAGAGALALTIGYRFAVADKDRRLLQKSFGLYLAPDVISRMLNSSKLPELGGETRNVTVFFSDLEGFSKIAEQITPESLTALMNEYLTAMTDIIEAHGGYVDKYIGDSIVAVFGAPADDADHAANAARAALDCCTKLAELNREAPAFREHPLAQRIGINSGEAVVGNLGSRRRFNYSVMGDAVNLASRLEGANKFYGTAIIASEVTVELTGAGFAWRELDAIRVKGRTQALKIFELLAREAQLTEAQQKSSSDYAEGLARWRAGEFALAAESFGRSAAVDRAAAMFRDRAQDMAASPPGADWDPVRTLQEK